MFISIFLCYICLKKIVDSVVSSDLLGNHSTPLPIFFLKIKYKGRGGEFPSYYVMLSKEKDRFVQQGKDAPFSDFSKCCGGRGAGVVVTKQNTGSTVNSFIFEDAVVNGPLFIGTPIMFLAAIIYSIYIIGSPAILGAVVILLFYPIMVRIFSTLKLILVVLFWFDSLLYQVKL